MLKAQKFALLVMFFNSGDENNASDLIPTDVRDILNSYKAMFL